MTDNLTRGQYGVTPRPEKVVWDDERNGWMTVTDEEWQGVWGCWDPDHGWQAPWPVERG